MSAIDIATWFAVVILTVGSLAIFCWFLVDARRLLRDPAAGEEGTAASSRGGRKTESDSNSSG